MVSDIDRSDKMQRVALLLGLLRELANERFSPVGTGDVISYRMTELEGEELIALIRTTHEFALDCVSEDRQ